jgi:hypothetical protein
MAATALGGEVLLARAGIADQDAGSLFPNGWGLALRTDGFEVAADLCGDCQPVLRFEGNRGHALVLPATLDDG